MGTVKVFAGVELGKPWLEFRNERNDTVEIAQILFMRGYAGSCPTYRPAEPFRIEPGNALRTNGQESARLATELRKVFKKDEAEVVVRIGVDLKPLQADHDQPPPAFYVVRMTNDHFTEFFSLSDSLAAEPSAFGALLESHRQGA